MHPLACSFCCIAVRAGLPLRLLNTNRNDNVSGDLGFRPSMLVVALLWRNADVDVLKALQAEDSKPEKLSLAEREARDRKRQEQKRKIVSGVARCDT